MTQLEYWIKSEYFSHRMNKSELSFNSLSHPMTYTFHDNTDHEGESSDDIPERPDPKQLAL
jgi:hypothetical protein